MTDLAAQAALSTSGITRIVDRLEASGLVQHGKGEGA
jgi:DNA-binding MarR family transcriptional regulator